MCHSKNQIDQLSLVAALQKLGGLSAAATDPISCIVNAVQNNMNNPVALVLALLACGLSLTTILTCITQAAGNPAALLACLLGSIPPTPGI